MTFGRAWRSFATTGKLYAGPQQSLSHLSHAHAVEKGPWGPTKGHRTGIRIKKGTPKIGDKGQRIAFIELYIRFEWHVCSHILDSVKLYKHISTYAKLFVLGGMILFFWGVWPLYWFWCFHLFRFRLRNGFFKLCFQQRCYYGQNDHTNRLFKNVFSNNSTLLVYWQSRSRFPKPPPFVSFLSN